MCANLSCNRHLTRKHGRSAATDECSGCTEQRRRPPSVDDVQPGMLSGRWSCCLGQPTFLGAHSFSLHFEGVTPVATQWQELESKTRACRLLFEVSDFLRLCVFSFSFSKHREKPTSGCSHCDSRSPLLTFPDVLRENTWWGDVAGASRVQHRCIGHKSNRRH